MTELLILALAYVQNISFTMVSRARNRDSRAYHASCAVASNLVWFATFHQLVTADMSWLLLLPYTVGTGAEVSVYIEKKIGAKT